MTTQRIADALRNVIAVSDRKTDVYDEAHTALAEAATLRQQGGQGGVDDDTLIDIARRVGLRQQFTGVNATDTKFLLRAFVDALAQHGQPQGEVVVTKDAAGNIVAVTRQDAEGRVLSTIATAPQHGQQGEEQAVADPIGLSAECYIGEKQLKMLRDPEIGACFIERAKSDRATIPLFTLESITGSAIRARVPERALLRAIVDAAWNAATDSEQVPSTNWADRIIDRALAAAPSAEPGEVEA